MFEPRVTAVIFEGGQARTELDLSLLKVRKQVVLDTIEKLRRSDVVAEVVLATNYPDLSAEAKRLGATVDLEDPSDPPFHFGRRLREVIVERGIDNVLYMGGTAAPLLSTGDFSEIARALKRERNVVIMNNVQSADLVAFTPARAIDEIELPDKDNPLGTLLRDIGMRRVLTPNSGRVNFDLDTPTDILILGMHPDCGARAKAAVDSLDWSRDVLYRALDVLRQDSKEVAIIGRVGPSVISYVNSNMVHRTRVFSEERGMKALGREDRGEVVSLLGFMLNDIGPAKFFKYLSQVADVVFLDSRVVFAHLRKRLSDWDRFYSDLGLYEKIEDHWTREFTKAALEADVPVVLGGHSLVAAGLWLLAEMVVKERESAGYRHNTFVMSRQ